MLGKNVVACKKIWSRIPNFFSLIHKSCSSLYYLDGFPWPVIEKCKQHFRTKKTQKETDWVKSMSISIEISMENYFQSLNQNDKLAYRNKLRLKSGETLPNPYSLRNDWIEDVDALSEVSWADVTHYLIETPSIYIM